MKRLSFLMVLVVFVIAFTFQMIPAQAFPVSGWTKIYEGIERADGMATSPRLMRCWAFRINLCNPDVWPYASHDNGGSPYEVTLQGANTFLSEHGLKVAANASFWNTATSPNVDVYGLVMSNGTVVSAADWGGYAFCFTSEKVATIAAPGTIPAGTYNAVAGCEMILTNGVKSGNNTNLNPFTGYGMTSDGKYLIMVCVDGRQPGWSDGCTQMEMAQWLIDFGAYNGIIEDGGGSTTMVRQDIGVINRPCYGYVRQVAVSLGIGSTPGNRVGPDCCSMNANRVDLVVRGNLNHIWLKTWTSAGGWAAPVDLGGEAYNDPAICSVADGRLDVFYCDTANMIKMKTWTTGGGWTNWVDSGNYFSSVAVCRRNSTTIELAGRGTDTGIYQRTYNTSTSTWSTWKLLGGSTIYTPGICVQASGCCCVFIRDSGTSHLYLKYGGPDTWYGWADLGGGIDGPPTAISRSQNILDVFARGNNYQLQHIPMSNDGYWGAWENMGGSVGKVAVCSLNANTINTYTRGTSDELWLKQWTGAGGWAGFTYQGNCFY